MADPIRLPNNTPKGIPTAKVTRTTRQRFKNRQKKQRQKQDMRHLLNGRRKDRLETGMIQTGTSGIRMKRKLPERFHRTDPPITLIVARETLSMSAFSLTIEQRS